MSAPRRIIQVSSYYPPHLGGQENAVQGLAQQLAGAGHDVHVVASHQGGGPPGATVEDNIKINRLRSFVFGHAPIMPAFVARLAGLARKPSVVHLHIGQAYSPEMTWLTSKLRGFPYIAQLHIDFEPSGPASMLLPLYKRTLLGPALRGAAAVITLNQATLQKVRHTYGYRGPITVLHNGIDESYFNLQRKAFKQKPPTTLKLLFVGRLSKQKNVMALLLAVKAAQHPVQLDIIGDGEDREMLQNAVKILGLKNVRLHGRLDRQAINAFYETSDALVMPSLYEAQPLVLLEALAARIPIIGTNVIGVAEHIQDAGIIVEPTAKGIAQGIARFITDYQTLPALTAHGYHKAQAFRWGPTIKMYEALYDAVARS